MNANELNAHDRHYDSDKRYKQALFESLDQVGLISLESDMREFTLALWARGFAFVPKNEKTMAELIRIWWQRLWCRHEYEIIHRDYPDAYQIRECKHCKQTIWEDLP